MHNYKCLNTKHKSRNNLWIDFINANKLSNVAEIGVYKGEFAEDLLRNCKIIQKYYLIDPWKNLSNWNKPANVSDSDFDNFYNETLKRTHFAKEKRKILQGKTSEVIHQIKSESIDFIYIDGDHTLRGITIDLFHVWEKTKENGFIAGDDFSPSIWQHNYKYEPSMVFPFAVYFAEAMDVKIYGLPFNQFLICKGEKGFGFIDITNDKYKNRELRKQFVYPLKEMLKEKLIKFFNKIVNIR